MAVKNSTILERIWLNGTNDYQQRVPDPTQSDISQTLRALTHPMNGKLWNEFVAGYINLIGWQEVHAKAWTNPLNVFRGAQLQWGSTIQESAVKWLEAHAYRDDDETLLKVNRPEVEVAYHTLNRQDRYDISVQRDELMMAFRDQYGLNRLIDAIMQAPINSDNYDEYRIMLQLIAEYDDGYGIFREQVAAPDDEASAKAFLRVLRTFARSLAFPSARYNGVDIPIFAKPEELVLLITPEALAALDVEALAAVFNLDKADIPYRTVVVDEFPVPNAYALLTTDAFFVMHDKLYQTSDFYNPQTLVTNYYLHHWEVLSISPFVPAILFTDQPGTAVPTVTMALTELTLAAEKDKAAPGDAVQLTATVTGTLDPETNGPVHVAPDAAVWSVSATRTVADATEAVDLNSATYVDRFGVLHLQKSVLKAGDVVKVNATSTYINPSGETNQLTATVNVTVA